MSSNNHFDLEEINNFLIVTFKNEKILNETNIKVIHDDLIQLIEGREGVRLVIDFKVVRYLSSSVLSKLVSVFKKVKSLKGEFTLCSIDPVLRKVFEITQLDRLFTIVPDQLAAMKR
ncbi:MAG: anti-sigma factor antagonist [bacterium]|nr:anti-sigma factor antagonist [bacterium]